MHGLVGTAKPNTVHASSSHGTVHDFFKFKIFCIFSPKPFNTPFSAVMLAVDLPTGRRSGLQKTAPLVLKVLRDTART